MKEDKYGSRERALAYMELARDWRHPKAAKQLESWQTADDPDAYKTDLTEVRHRRNDADYKEQREKGRSNLKAAQHFLASGEIDRAIERCGLVLVEDPYNTEALRLLDRIQKRRATVLGKEKQITRKGMIADVDKAWRPPYAVNAREFEMTKPGTEKTELADDPVRSLEQSIIARMKKMRLPSISFKPPATIADAVEFFKGASKDFDDPELPLEQRGFNFWLRSSVTEYAKADTGGSEDADDFSDDGEGASAGQQGGLPVIQMISANDITFYDALKLVCDSVNYKFKVQGSMVIVMHKDMSIEEMATRSYPVVAAFQDRMNSVSGDMKEMSDRGFGRSITSKGRKGEDDGEESQERVWKDFFSLMGVQWPEGSSILYIKTIGKLRVRNTFENLAELEKALTELNVDQKLVEIEARFVEVCQEDLNSLGFEWILNSDYSLDLGSHISRALNLSDGAWGTSDKSYSLSQSGKNSTGYDHTEVLGSNGSRIKGPTWGETFGRTGSDVESFGRNYQEISPSQGARWIQSQRNSGKTLGVSSIGGTSAQQNGMRYLSTVGNAIDGQSRSTNDQFMKLNAFIGNADLSMILHMLSQRSDTDLLSAPKVLTRPGEEAVIKVVTEYIYPTDYDVQLQSSSSNSGGNNSGGGQSAILAVVEPQSFTMREVGVILDVVPTLTDDGNLIDLKLDTKVVDEPTWKNYGMKIPYSGNSSLQNFQGLGEIFTGLGSIFQVLGEAIPNALKASLAEQATASAGNALESLSASGDNITYYDAPMEQPFFHVRSIESSVSIYPGATIVMGGLITEARTAMDDKIPILGDIPYIGRLFRSHAEKTTKRNLLIFITSRLVDVRGREVTIGSGSDATVKPKPDEVPAE